MKTAQQRRVVVITGAGAGVGRATAIAFAGTGARVALLGRGVDGLEGARGDVEAAGGEALVVLLDVADAEAVDRAASTVEEAFGPIDVWVNNAMVSVFAPASVLTAEEYRRVDEVTHLGAVHGTLSALRRMRSRDRGVIVQVGSALAYRSIPLQSAYRAAKHAVEGFTESLRVELMHEHSNVRVTLVHLPALNTPQFNWSRNKMPMRPRPVAPIFQPEVAAEAIVWSVDHPRREVWVAFPTVEAIVGERIAPGLLDRYLGRTGYQAQLTDEPARSNAPDNLWDPLPGDPGAHGRFDEEARDFSVQLWWVMHARKIAGLVAASLLALAFMAIGARGFANR